MTGSSGRQDEPRGAAAAAPAAPAAARRPAEPARITLVLDGPIERDAIPGLCHQLGQLLEEEAVAAATATVVCDVRDVPRVDAATLDALARLQLTARRAGCELELRGVGLHLQRLLRLTGFAEILGLGDGDGAGAGEGSGIEVVGQPEEREQPLGVEEGVEPDDPVA